MSAFFYEPFYDIERFLDDTFHSPKFANRNVRAIEGGPNSDLNQPSGAVKALRPRMDLHEDLDKNQVTATFELPGMSKDDVRIDVQNGRMTITGEAQKSEEHEEKGYAVRERRYGRFTRTLQLPEGVKDEEIKANLENGVLTVVFPKAAPEAAPKRISVS